MTKVNITKKMAVGCEPHYELCCAQVLYLLFIKYYIMYSLTIVFLCFNFEGINIIYD